MCSASRPANNASASATYQHAVDELRASSTNNATSVLSCTPGEGALKTKLRKQDTQSSARIQLLGFDRAQLMCVWAMLTLAHAVAFGVSVSGSPRASSTIQQICVYLDRSSQRHAHRDTYERDGYGEAAWAQPSSDEAPLRARARLRARIAVYLAGVGIGLISLAGYGQSYKAPNGVPAPGTRCGNSWGQADETPGFSTNRTVVAAVVAWYGPGTQHLKWGWLYALTTYLALWTSFTSILPPASALVSHEDVNIQHRRSAYPELELGYRRCCRIVNGELVQPYSKSFMWKVNIQVCCSVWCFARSALRTLNSHSSILGGFFFSLFYQRIFWNVVEVIWQLYVLAESMRSQAAHVVLGGCMMIGLTTFVLPVIILATRWRYGWGYAVIVGIVLEVLFDTGFLVRSYNG